MEVQIGVAKINKYATSESGDTLEVVERPGGGVSIVLADGQRSGKSAKRISNMVGRKVISLLAEGVRDGAAARAGPGEGDLGNRARSELAIGAGVVEGFLVGPTLEVVVEACGDRLGRGDERRREQRQQFVAVVAMPCVCLLVGHDDVELARIECVAQPAGNRDGAGGPGQGVGVDFVGVDDLDWRGVGAERV